MKISIRYFFVLCIVSCCIGLYILAYTPLYEKYTVLETIHVKFRRQVSDITIDNKTRETRNTAHRLLRMIEKSDSTFNMSVFDGQLERLDILCWMYRTQKAKEIGLKVDSSDCLQSVIDAERNLVPLNVFYTIYGGYNMTLLNYMSAISIRRVMPDANIYLICDILPVGFWWKKIIEDVHDLRIIHRSRIPNIFDRKILLKEHMTDIIRLQVSLLSGGIYLDPDMIFLRPVDRFRKPDLTVGLIDKGTGLGNGLMFSKRHSKFLEFWYESYKTFNYTIWGFHSMKIPLILSQIYTHLINVDEGHIYSPNWFELENLYLKLVPWNKNIAVHMWTQHKYTLPTTMKDIDTTNSTACEMLRYVYYNDTRLRL